MAVIVLRGTKCPCGKKARPGQRTCTDCHAGKMKKYRAQRAKYTVTGYITVRNFLDYKLGFVPELTISSKPEKPSTADTQVKVTLCKNPKKQ